MRPAIGLKQSKIKNIAISGLAGHIYGLVNEGNPLAAIRSGKTMAKAWFSFLTDEERLSQSKSFIYACLLAYWWARFDQGQRHFPLLADVSGELPDQAVKAVAQAIGQAAAKLSLIDASYEIGSIYTALLPENYRSSKGIFYTPPALTHRLLTLSEEAGVNWAQAKVIDPACGGGAFLMPVALKMREALKDHTPSAIISHINNHLKGYEIDAFAAWLTGVFLTASLRDLIDQSSVPLNNLITIGDSLTYNRLPLSDRFDLVIGNPPYGKVRSNDTLKERYGEGLFGHPNLYGLFTHLATELVKPGSVISYLTPTSFLSGEYFKNLRSLLRQRVTPVELEVVSVRKGVFDDVLQETMLASYRATPSLDQVKVKVNQLVSEHAAMLRVVPVGQFSLPKKIEQPWILPRSPDETLFVQAMAAMTSNLQSWGYRVSTGQLVWNRHKEQLVQTNDAHTLPIVWSESITQDGRFVLKAEKKNHAPYFRLASGQDFLVVNQPCVLLQRTTSKEQDKRLIAAMLPASLCRKGVVVENHLNMLIPIVEKPLVSLAVLAAFLNSQAANIAFRAISGSVAVSAYELNCLPLPAPKLLKPLQQLIDHHGGQSAIEAACRTFYHST